MMRLHVSIHVSHASSTSYLDRNEPSSDEDEECEDEDEDELFCGASHWQPQQLSSSPVCPTTHL